MDLQSLVRELHIRGFNQDKVDSALRCLVHVYAVQGSTPSDTGGVLAEDILDKYELDVVQAATQLFLEKTMSQGREVFRVRWGCESAAEEMEEQLWAHATSRWAEFIAQIDERYLGFFLPQSDGDGRVMSDWKLSKEIRWFSVEVPSQGWKILGIIDDISEVAWKLDLAFGFRSFGSDGVQAPRALLHRKAFETLQARKVTPPDELLKSIRFWRFFSEYDVHSTDFVALMRECSLSLEEVVGQVNKFFTDNITSQYREGQYPPYFINDKKRKEFQQAVRELLQPMNAWLLRRDISQPASQPVVVASQKTGKPARSSSRRPSRPAKTASVPNPS